MLTTSGESKGFGLPLGEILRVGTILVAITVAFTSQRGDVAHLGQQLAETRESIKRQDDRVGNIGEQLRRVAVANELLHSDLVHLGRMLHEKHIIRDSIIASSVTPEPESEPTPAPDEPKKRNPVSRALRGTVRVLSKPFKEEE